jgi:hypothetical protein
MLCVYIKQALWSDDVKISKEVVRATLEDQLNLASPAMQTAVKEVAPKVQAMAYAINADNQESAHRLGIMVAQAVDETLAREAQKGKISGPTESGEAFVDRVLVRFAHPSPHIKVGSGLNSEPALLGQHEKALAAARQRDRQEREAFGNTASDSTGSPQRSR